MRQLIWVFVLVLCVPSVFGALSIGSNSGFVTSAPTADPAESASALDNERWASHDTSPSGSNQITEMGFYVGFNNNGGAIDYVIGYYDDDSGVPGALVNSYSGTFSGTGWVSVTGLEWSLSASTDYWLAMSVQNSGIVFGDRSSSLGSGRDDVSGSSASLTDPFNGGTLADSDGMNAVYAVYEVVSASSSCDCPASPQNWEIDMTEACTINDCANDGYNLSFVGSGSVYLNGSINVSVMREPAVGQTVYANANACYVRTGQ